MSFDRKKALRRRHRRVRTKIHGTAERPRLCIHKSSRHLYAQLIDDETQRTVVAVTTNRKSLKNGASAKSFCNVASAKQLGREIGELAIQKGVKAVVFDRGGYRYHGRVRSFAEAARKAGLQF
jgi:large subunit ribosomal protein L18